MQSYQIIIINGTLRAIGAFLLLSRRAHLLTTAKTRRVLVSGGISTFVETVRSPRVAAPLEPCGSCRRAANFRAVASPTTALSTLYHSLDSVGIAAATPCITQPFSQYFFDPPLQRLDLSISVFQRRIGCNVTLQKKQKSYRKD